MKNTVLSNNLEPWFEIHDKGKFMSALRAILNEQIMTLPVCFITSILVTSGFQIFNALLSRRSEGARQKKKNI
jgi:hypothetical protein